ncbi:MAG: ATP-dependent RNA helicase dbp10 [Chaenotheca gracillima]|nr:MAG: ATP-dependent RNA helicase dbp10 [Chaenotheca gracillima]
MSEEEIEKDALSALEKEEKEFNKDAEIDRILKAFKLDAYAVLDLKPGISESGIKVQYRKKSLLIHPDKTENPSAPDAFDRLNKAQISLLDEKERTRLDEAIADARQLLMRERKITADDEETRGLGPRGEDFNRAWLEKTKFVLIENEARRRKQLKAQMQEEGRAQRKEDEEIEARKRKRDHDSNWEQTRDVRINSWRDFQKGAKPTGDAPKKKKKMKPIG